MSDKQIMRTVVRVDRSPMNRKVWCYQLDCGHDVFKEGRKLNKPEMECDKCEPT